MPKDYECVTIAGSDSPADLVQKIQETLNEYSRKGYRYENALVLYFGIVLILRRDDQALELH